MESPVYANPRRVLGWWCALLAAGVMLVAAYHWALARRVEAMRAVHPWTYLRAAARAAERDDLQDALAQLDRAAQYDPDSPLPYERAGLIHYQLKQWPEAADAYRKAFERGSRDIGGRGKAIWCLIHLGEFDEAAQFGEDCIEKGLYSPRFYQYVGDAYLRGKKFPESIPYYQKALERFPDDLHLMDRLAHVYENVGDTGKAEAMRRRINEMEEQADSPTR